MTKKIDPDLIALKLADNALIKTSPRMRKATLEFLWDKYVVHPKKDSDEIPL